MWCVPQIRTAPSIQALTRGRGPLGMSGVQWIGSHASGPIEVTAPGYTFTGADFSSFGDGSWLNIRMQETAGTVQVEVNEPTGLAWLGGDQILESIAQGTAQKIVYAEGQVTWKHFDFQTGEEKTSHGTVRQAVVLVASAFIDLERSTASEFILPLRAYGSYGAATYTFSDGAQNPVDWLADYPLGAFHPPVITGSPAEISSRVMEGWIGTMSTSGREPNIRYVYVRGGRARGRLIAPF